MPPADQDAHREAVARGATVATDDTYLSMGYSRGASALGVALALGEIPAQAATDAVVCRDPNLYSTRASTSPHRADGKPGHGARQQRRVERGLAIGHGVMRDAIDVTALADALESVGLTLRAQLDADARSRIAAVLAKAEPSRTGLIRGRRHIMLDDSDVHARAMPARSSAASWPARSGTPSCSSRAAPSTKVPTAAARSR